MAFKSKVDKDFKNIWKYFSDHRWDASPYSGDYTKKNLTFLLNVYIEKYVQTVHKVWKNTSVNITAKTIIIFF